MKRSLLLLCLALFLALPMAAHAQENSDRPDDFVVVNLAAEDWVTTETARVLIAVEAAVTGKTSGAMRDTMLKAVGSVAAADWRLTNFARFQDETGMERWSALYESRLPEKNLNDLNEKAKKASKAGLQLKVAAIEFTPTLDERQETISRLRTALYKKAGEQLEILNKTIPGRSFRIASISFSDANGLGAFPAPRANMALATMKGGRGMMDQMAEAVPSDASMEKSEKIVITARVALAALPPSPSK